MRRADRLFQIVQLLRRRDEVFILCSGAAQRQSRGTLALARSIVAREGIAALGAGLPARVAKVAPACAIMISSYEGVKQLVARDSV